jgi:iron complex transport system ATP-binding protein
MSLVEVSRLVTGYAPGRPALSAVTFSLDAGEALAVLGPNGGGKTTLLRLLLGELPVMAGTCVVEGSPAYVA